MKKPTVRPVPQYPIHETYEKTFSDWQQHNDQTVWQGCGDIHEFPHNKGAKEEKQDELQHVRYMDHEDGKLDFGTYGEDREY